MIGRGDRPATQEYCVAEAENGFIFSWYKTAEDKIEYWVASTPDELADIIRKWQEDRIAVMLSYQKNKPK